MICIFCRKYYRIRILELKEGFVMIPFTGKQLQLIQLLMEQSTPIALDENITAFACRKAKCVLYRE